jgi:hypothetical protein
VQPPRIRQGVGRNLDVTGHDGAGRTEGKIMTTTHTMKKLAGKAALSAGAALVAVGLASGTAHAFNPQPDPPGKPISAFNPQPDPPGKQIVLGVHQALTR